MGCSETVPAPSLPSRQVSAGVSTTSERQVQKAPGASIWKDAHVFTEGEWGLAVGLQSFICVHLCVSRNSTGLCEWAGVQGCLPAISPSQGWLAASMVMTGSGEVVGVKTQGRAWGNVTCCGSMRFWKKKIIAGVTRSVAVPAVQRHPVPGRDLQPSGMCDVSFLFFTAKKAKTWQRAWLHSPAALCVLSPGTGAPFPWGCPLPRSRSEEWINDQEMRQKLDLEGSRSRHHGRWKVSSCPCTYHCLRIDSLPDMQAMTWKEFRLRQILHRASMRPLGPNKGKSIMPLPWRPWHSHWGGAPGAGAARRRHGWALGPTSLCQHPGKRPSSSSWGQRSAKGDGCPSPKGGLSPDAEPLGIQGWPAQTACACYGGQSQPWVLITEMILYQRNKGSWPFFSAPLPRALCRHWFFFLCLTIFIFYCGCGCLILVNSVPAFLLSSLCLLNGQWWKFIFPLFA